MRRSLMVVALLVVLAGCSEEEPEDEVIDVSAQITSAADALECPDDAQVQTQTVEAESAEETADAAIEAWVERTRQSADIPPDGYEVTIEEVGRVLYTYETEHRADIAVIAEREVDGWVVRSWARCGPSTA